MFKFRKYPVLIGAGILLIILIVILMNFSGKRSITKVSPADYNIENTLPPPGPPRFPGNTDTLRDIIKKAVLFFRNWDLIFIDNILHCFLVSFPAAKRQNQNFDNILG